MESPGDEIIADSEPSAAFTSSQAALSSPSASVDQPTASAATFAPPIVPLRHAKPAARTYGRRAPIADASSGDGLVQASKPLAPHSSTLIPETEPLNGDLEEEVHDRARPTEMNGDLASSSSPSKRTEHSTDPTSEEDTPVVKKKPAMVADANVSRIEGSSDVSSDGDDSDEKGALAFFKNKKTAQELADEIDRMDDDEVHHANMTAQIKALGSDSTLTSVPNSDSTLTSLVTSDPPSTLTTNQLQAFYPDFDHSSDPLLDEIAATLPPLPPLPTLPPLPDLPTLPSRNSDLSMSEADDEDEEQVGRAGRHKASKPRRRVIDSDEEDAQEDDLPHHPRSRSSVIVVESSEGDRSAPTLSKRERIALLAQKRAPPPVPVAEEPRPRERSASIVSDDSEGADKKQSKAKAKAARVKGALSKKAETDMHKETAALQRNQDARLQPRVKHNLKVQDIIRKTANRPIYSNPPRERHVDMALSSDPILTGSDSPARPSHLSEKAQGKLRAMSPIDIDDTPVAARRVVLRPNNLAPAYVKEPTPAAATLVPEDEDEELLPLDQMLAKRQQELVAKKAAEAKAAEAKRFAERKAAAAAREASVSRTRRATTILSDSDDSDLEIEGAPAPTRSRVFSTPDFDRASTPRALSRSERNVRAFTAPSSSHHHHQEEDPSESQLAEAGHTFGRDLMANHQMAAPRRRSKKGPKPSHAPNIDNDALNRALLQKAKVQSLDMVIKKRSAFVRRTHEAAEKERLGVGAEVARVDVKAMMAKKAEAAALGGDVDEDEDAADEDAADEDAADEDYEEEEAADSDAVMGGSGSEVEGPPSSQRAAVEQEAEEDAGAELPSEAAVDDEDDEAMPAPVVRGKKVRLAVASDDEEAPPVAPVAVAPEIPIDIQQVGGQRLALAGLEDDGDRGFSQFFDSQFSQDVGNVNEVEGFHRKDDSAGAPAPTLMGHVFLNEAERAEDVELLENRGVFNDVEPNTPREAPAPRQYLNKHGLLTQTRPANLFGNSPSDSPLGSEFSQIGSLPRSSYSTNHESQMTQTQLAATQTPTQASKDPSRLRRGNHLIGYDSYGSLPATEVVPEEDEEEDETQEESFPTAAQPSKPANAFELLRAAANKPHSPVAPIAAAPVGKKQRSAFIDTEADMSDEEEGALGRASGDEDETGMDAELESLVDNEEVDRELRDEQDEMVDELYAEDMAKKDAEELARAQRIADGKERNKRGALDLDDDDFDDDWGVSKRPKQKQQRVDNMTTAELTANEETQAFAMHITEGLTHEVKAGELDFLKGPEDDGEEEYEEDDEEEETQMLPPQPRISVHEATRMAVERSKQRKEEQSRQRSPTVDLPQVGHSSSPMPQYKIKSRSTTEVSLVTSHVVDDYADLDSQGFLKVTAHSIEYKFDTRDEGQGGTNGTTAGANSAVTSFAKNPKRTTSAPALAGSKAKGGKPLAAKGSSFGFRKTGFS